MLQGEMSQFQSSVIVHETATAFLIVHQTATGSATAQEMVQGDWQIGRLDLDLDKDTCVACLSLRPDPLPKLNLASK